MLEMVMVEVEVEVVGGWGVLQNSSICSLSPPPHSFFLSLLLFLLLFPSFLSHLLLGDPFLK